MRLQTGYRIIGRGIAVNIENQKKIAKATIQARRPAYQNQAA
jgi:hypothetical protein